MVALLSVNKLKIGRVETSNSRFLFTGNVRYRESFSINESGDIEHVFNKFKTKDHHEVVLDYLNSSDS